MVMVGNYFMIYSLVVMVCIYNAFASAQTDKCSSFGGCKGLSLVSRLTADQLGWFTKTMCTSLWGWVDSSTNKKYIILTCEPGQSIIDVTDPSKPKAIAKLAGHAGGKFRWRDVKVYKDHAFFVSDALLSRVQVLDLKEAVKGGSGRRMLRSGNIVNGEDTNSIEGNGNNNDQNDEEIQIRQLEDVLYNVTVSNEEEYEDVVDEDNDEVKDESEDQSESESESEDDTSTVEFGEMQAASSIKSLKSSAIYQGGGLYQSHNIEINPESGFAYSVGGGNNCNNGLHMINLSDPMKPKFAGCFYDVMNQYIHDAHCRSYKKEHLGGKYAGKEICFGFAVLNLLIIDVTDKSNPKLLSRISWPDASYIHQGWLTEDRNFLVVDDERDEPGEGIKTFIIDVRDLNKPRLGHVHVAVGETFGDHNQYVLKIGKHDYTFQANYAGGIRVLRIKRGEVKGVSDDEILSMEEVAFFKTNRKNNAEMEGVWSAWPYFDDLVITADMDNGFFILKRTFDDSTPAIPYKTNGKTPSPTVWSDCPSFKDKAQCESRVACVWDIDWVQLKGWFWGCYNSKTIKPTKPYRAPEGGPQACNRFEKAQCNMYPACIFRNGCSPFN